MSDFAKRLSNSTVMCAGGTANITYRDRVGRCQPRWAVRSRMKPPSQMTTKSSGPHVKCAALPRKKSEIRGRTYVRPNILGPNKGNKFDYEYNR